MVDIEYYRLTDNILVATSEMGFIAGVIALENFAVGIDSTLFPYTGGLLRKRSKSLFKLPMRMLFLTHYHGDHFWGIASFNDTVIIGSEALTQNIIDERKIQPTRFEEWKKEDPEKAQLIEEIDTSFLPHITFRGDIKIQEGDLSIDLYHSGGHTSCSSYAYFPYDKTLFAGDLIFAKEWPWAGDPTSNPEKWINALSDILKLNIDKVIPGHGPITGKEEIEVYFNFLQELKEETIVALNKEIGVESIKVPTFYKDKTPGEWVKKDTINCFYNFYKNQC
jgi:glyoxylase-like metal-dependent hydrolase (beta-lactamase superfamily II)